MRTLKQMIDGQQYEAFTVAWSLLLHGDVRIKRKDWQRWLYLEEGKVIEIWPSGRKTAYEPTVSDLLAVDYVIETVVFPEEPKTSPGKVEWVER